MRVTILGVPVVAGFGLINDAIVATVDATDKGTDAFSRFFRIYFLGQTALKGNQDAVDELTKALDENRKITNENSVQVIGSTGVTMDFMDVVGSLNDVYANFNDGVKQNRQQVLIATTQTKKYGEEIDKKLNPIFGEQNALLLTNIQLETDRNRLLKLTSSANDNVEKAEKERAKALKNVEELQIAENVADAQAAIRKSELQTQIALLTSAEESGKDVTNELALARAELAEAEFELVNDSDRLLAARLILEVAENNLSTALDNQKLAIDTRNDALLESIDLTNKAAEANKKFIDQGALLTQFREIESAPVATQVAKTEVPSLPVTDFSTRFTGAGLRSSTIDLNLNLTDAIGEIIQEQNIRIQERGNTFVLEG